MTKNMNICVSQTDILQNATSVVGKIKKIKHRKKSKTVTRLNCIYTGNEIQKMSDTLFKALNNRLPYNSRLNLNKIYNDNANELSDFDSFKKFCISLFNNDFRSKSYNKYGELMLSEPYCQYCHVKSSNALDHFFDKNSFPELAIFPDNLIPVCTNCNSAKRGNFVYPYFEVLRSANWLKCNVRPDGTFAFYISKDAAKNKFEEKILNDLERQFKARKVFNDYIIVGQTTLTPLISNIKYKKMNNFNRDDVKNEIEYINNSSNKELLIQTKYFEIAIRKGFLENFDEIWNAI